MEEPHVPPAADQEVDAPASPIDARTLADILPIAAAAAAPGAGLVDLDGSLRSWPDVLRQTRSMAAQLQRVGVARGDRVAILHPKSAASFVAVHAVLAAGAVVVPLDPLGAARALGAIFDQCDVAAVFVDPATAARLLPEALTESSVPVLHLVDPTPLLDLGLEPARLVEAEVDSGAEPTPHPHDPEDPAYLIFTSGSTGAPKGMVHSHRSGLAYARSAIDHHRLDGMSRVAGIPPLHFDMSTLELYSTPLVGATAVSISEAEQRFPATLSERLADEAVTHVYAVPFLLRQLQERGALERRDLGRLRHIGYAGEPYAPGAVAELMRALPAVEVTNLYGPAETNVVTSHDLPGPPDDSSEVPIGRLWPGCEARLVREDGSEADPGEPAELWVSAPTCMTEYWRRPDLTAERLHPRADGWPWYATGDIVVSEPEPTDDRAERFNFVGRRDNQVKIRGVRLELEPIESVLTDAPGVEHAVVGAIETDDGKALKAVVVLEPGRALVTREIKRWCAGQLPAAAVPVDFEVRDVLPTTASGKIDRARVRSALAGETTDDGTHPNGARPAKDN